MSCLTVHGWKEKCQVNRRLPGAWIVALIVMICGCLATVATIAFMIYSHWRRSAVVLAKWTGLGVGEICAKFSQLTVEETWWFGWTISGMSPL